jgi:hypothetical protein
MMMNKINLLIAFLCCQFFHIHAQQNLTLKPKPTESKTQTENKAQSSSQQLSPDEIVNHFFKLMSKSDTTGMRGLFTKDATLQSSNQFKAESSISSSSISDFINSITKHKPGSLDERISNLKTMKMVNIATVTMDYDFFYNSVYSHSGVNVFNFLMDKEGWKISSLSDTRFKKLESPVNEKDRVEKFLDDWHLAASKADIKTYFDMLHDKSIYIGTDETEVWTKEVFYNFAKPYFEKGKAWDFVKKSRNIYLYSVEGVIWFDEVLDTWMGPCRGSGFIVKDEKGNMKIMQYVLSMAIPNDKVYDVIKASGSPTRKK